MNIGSLLITILFSVIGIGSTVVIIGLLILTLAQKIIGKIKDGKSLYD